MMYFLQCDNYFLKSVNILKTKTLTVNDVKIKLKENA